MTYHKTLFVIPARGGSKGVPKKNTKILAGLPLVLHSLAYARLFVPDEQICISTDDKDVLDLAKKEGYDAPFIRPEELARDTTSTFDVLKHALRFYAEKGKYWENVVLLQPTSPFRLKSHLEEMVASLQKGADVIVSVTESKNSPYFNLFEENTKGFLHVSKTLGNITRRQDCPPTYVFNGSLYLFRATSLQKANGFVDFSSIQKYTMASRFSVDLDTPKDFLLAQWLWENQDEQEPLWDWK